MSDQKPENENNPPEASPPVDPARRKLTGAALGAGAVFTLSSRPVWASRCTISGMMSGNLSKPMETCHGCTPGYWKVDQHLDSWAATGFTPLDVKDHMGNIIKKADTFNKVFGVTQYVKSNGAEYTLLEVMRDLNGGGDPISTNLGFHAVAALLNAAHPSVNYGYTAGEIIDLFKANYLSNGAALKDSFAMLNERVCPLN